MLLPDHWMPNTASPHQFTMLCCAVESGFRSAQTTRAKIFYYYILRREKDQDKYYTICHMIICQIKLDIFPERQAKIEAEISIPPEYS